MHHIIYMSRANAALTPADLVALLVQARRANEQMGLTGVLVHGDGQFMQVIEGEQAQVTALYRRIEQDARHYSVFKVADKEIEERVFVNWTMGFRDLPAKQFADLIGYVPPAQWSQLEFVTNAADVLFYKRLQDLMVASFTSS